MSEKIIPQDGGTGLDLSTADADWAAAAAVAALAAQGQSPFVVSGFGFTVDDVNDEVTVAEGQALLEETALSDGRTTGMDWPVGAFPCRHPETTVGLYPDEETDVYLDADIKDTSPDTLSIVSVDSEFGTPPDEPRLLLGTIHPDYSTTLENRVPAFDELAVTGRSEAGEVVGIANAARHHIASDESATIPADHSEVVEGPLSIAGELTIGGRLTIL